MQRRLFNEVLLGDVCLPLVQEILKQGLLAILCAHMQHGIAGLNTELRS
jgi:hypothetical protein